MRIAFSLILNGLHHLKHKKYLERIHNEFDWWIFVEGFAKPTGSTHWCNDLSSEFPNGLSTDGTTAYLQDLSETDSNVFHIKCVGKNKDEMCNEALNFIKTNLSPTLPCFLWEVDVDEQWTKGQLAAAEIELDLTQGSCGCFHANYHVGEGLYAVGCWGEGCDETDPIGNAYRRLWRWDGTLFDSHEPPRLIGGNGKEVLLTPRFEHYAYYFPQDVSFKQKYYSGHNNIYDKWLSLNKETQFPQPISKLIDGYWGITNTKIIKNIESS